MISRKRYYDSIQRQSLCDDNEDGALDIINAADMDETYGIYVDDACLDIHDSDDDTDDDIYWWWWAQEP